MSSDDLKFIVCKEGRGEVLKKYMYTKQQGLRLDSRFDGATIFACVEPV